MERVLNSDMLVSTDIPTEDGFAGSEENDSGSSREILIPAISMDINEPEFTYLPCISMVKMNDQEYWCKICHKCFSDQEQLEEHGKEQQHITAQNKHGCKNILLNGKKEYYCNCCSYILGNHELALEHITEERHMINANLPCIFIQLSKTKKFICRICIAVFHSQEDLRIHVKGNQHEKAKKKYGCNNISLQEDSQYYCRCCDCKLINRYFVWSHLRYKRHKSVLKKSIEQHEIALAAHSIDGDEHMENANLSCIPIKSLKDNKYFCEICNGESFGQEDFEMHVKQKHQSNSNLPCISITQVDVNNYRCTLCDVVISGQIDLDNHVKDRNHSEAQKIYGCDNISLKEDNLYYCGCCDCPLTNRQLASEHIKEEEHKINANLPCISLMLLDIDMYYCRICDVDLLDPGAFATHVNKKQHQESRKYYGCDQISRKSANLYYCGWCNCTLKSRRLASEHIKKETHIRNAPLPCISIRVAGVKKYHCGICDKDNIEENCLMIHVYGKRHITAQKKYGCNNIVLKEGNLYYCRCCNSTLSSRGVASQHIKDGKHLNALKVSEKEGQSTIKIIPVATETTEQPKIELAADSIKEDKLINNSSLRCISTLSSREVASQHIKDGKHLNALEVSEKEGESTIKIIPLAAETTKQPKIELAADSIKQDKLMSNSSLPCISIKPLEDKNYFCGICNIKSSDEKDLETHVNGLRHRTAQKEYGCSNIVLKEGNLYYCRCCNSTLSSRKVAFQHIKDGKHLNALKVLEKGGASTIKIIPTAAETTKQPKIELAADSMKGDKLIINSSLPCISIKPLEDKTYFCGICNVKSSGKKDLETHAKGLRHRRAQKEYGCNNIVLKEDNLYYCRCCNSTLSSRGVASQHIKDGKHLNALKVSEKEGQSTIKIIPLAAETTEQPKIELAADSMKEDKLINNSSLRCISTLSSREVASQHIKDGKHLYALEVSEKEGESTIKIIPLAAETTKQPKIELAADSIKEDKLMSNSSLPCISIKPLEDKTYFCGICNVKSSGKKDLETHAKGLRHRRAQKEYGCNNIVLKEDNLYYCRCCNSTLSSRGVASQHIKDGKHLNALKVSEKEGQSTIKIIPLAAETTEQPKIELAADSMKEDKLINNSSLRCISTLSSREVASQHIKDGKHLNALEVSEKEGESTIKIIPLAAETTKQPKIELAADSIKEDKLMSNSSLPCISIKPWEDKTYFCRICNVKSSGKKDLETHVKGLRHRTAQKEYGCNNIVLKEGNLYYCRCCNSTLSNRKVAFQHIKDGKHLNALKVLEKEGESTIKIIPLAAETTEQPKIELAADSMKEDKLINNSSLRCISTLSSREVASQHIKDGKHLNALEVSEKEGESTIKIIPLAAETTKQPKIELAADSIKEDKLMSNSSLPCISIKPLEDKTYFCRICNVKSSGKKDLETHVKGLRHRTAQKEYGCNNIVLKEGNLYYCRCCNSTLSNRKVAFQHIKDGKHLNALKVLEKEGESTIKIIPTAAETTKQPKIELAANSMKEDKLISNSSLPCISIKPLEDKKYFCGICNVKSSSEKDLETHVNGLRHRTAQKEYGCNNIVLKEGNLYYCRCCNSTLLNHKVAFQHIKDGKHLNALKVLEKEGESTIKIIPTAAETTKQPKIELAADSMKEDKLMSNSSLPCISIKPLEDKKYFCGICNVKSSNEKDLETHVKGLHHRTAQKEYGCKNIVLKEGNLYYCRCCNFTLSSRDVASQHIKEIKHINALNISDENAQMTKKEIPNIAESTNQSKGIVEPIFENISGSYILQETTTDFYCAICDRSIYGQTNIDGHAVEKQHIQALQVFFKNKIYMNASNFYYCQYCNCEIQCFKNVHQHMAGNRHAINMSINKSVADIQDQQISKTIQPKTKKIDGAVGFTLEKLLSHFIVKVGKNLHCKICNINIAVAKDHIMENQHKIGLQIFDKEQITLENDHYYCNYCSCQISGSENVHQHINEPNHAICKIITLVNVINYKLMNGNQELKTSNTIPLKMETRKSDDVSGFTAEELFHHSIVKVGEQLKCKTCNIGFVTGKDHIMEKRHKINLQKFHENQIMLKNHIYYCQICDCNLYSYPNVDQHVKGRSHQAAKNNISSLTPSHEKNEPAEQNVENKAKIDVEPHVKATSSSISNKGIKSENQFSNVTTNEKRTRAKRSKKSHAKTKVCADKDKIRCNVCNVLVEGASNLHVHLAQHYSADFITTDKNDESTEQKEVTKTQTTNSFKLIEEINYNEKAVKRMERTVNMEKILRDLDSDANYIYSMDDKYADIKLGMQLCYPLDNKVIYCFVCQEEVEISIENYYQHLRTKLHCDYLADMETDHSRFASVPDQFSELDLARQYIRETEHDNVYCFICDMEFNDIRMHISEKNHHKKCVQLKMKTMKNFENMELMSCDWYDIETYWCVPCQTKFRSEANFTKHLESELHAHGMKQFPNTKTKLIFDFCAPCALLWYGYRTTSHYHDYSSKHMWQIRDGCYFSIKFSESAKFLLTNPEDFVDKIIKHFDDISENERAKEAMLIRDIEKSVESKLLHAKAYTFGSRVSGLGSSDSDIDVFLDCGDMYDGDSSMERILKYMTEVHVCLSKEPHLWEVIELLTTCRSPIIKAHHRVTGLFCDISFEHGLAVENTLLIKSFNDIFPSCRKIILIVKEWLKLCNLSGSSRITSYAVYWFVIFYLQKESILPSIATLIKMKNESQIIAGWEVGVFRDFTVDTTKHNFTIKELLIRFFKFYANFDYRQEVACPLLGEVVAKRAFADPASLPDEMGPYKTHVKKSGQAFRIDSVMCIQDPFDLQHNLCKAVSKGCLNRFRKYCSKSLDVLCAF